MDKKLNDILAEIDGTQEFLNTQDIDSLLRKEKHIYSDERKRKEFMNLMKAADCWKNKLGLIASSLGYKDLLKEAVAKYNVSLDKRTLIEAAKGGHLDVCKYLLGEAGILKKNSNTNEKEEYLRVLIQVEALSIAAANGHFKVLEWAIKAGIKSDFDTVLNLAKSGETEILRNILERKCSWTQDIWEVLLKALRDKPKKNKNDFSIFIWAYEMNLINKDINKFIKCFNFLQRVPQIFITRRKRNEKGGKKELNGWGKIISITKNIIKSKIIDNKPEEIETFYWHVAKEKYDYNVDSFDIDSRDDQLKENLDEDEQVSNIVENLAINNNDIVKDSSSIYDDDDEFYPENERVNEASIDESCKSQIEQNVSEGTLELSSQVNQWILDSDTRWVGMFFKRIEKLSNGMNSYACCKQLKGTKKYKIFESKLDKGQRILWTKVWPNKKDYDKVKAEAEQRGIEYIEDVDIMKPRLLIWYVCKHDEVSHHMQNIENSFNRVGIANFENLSTHLIQQEILVEPHGNSLMKMYTKSYSDMQEELNQKLTPKFELRLTRAEKKITRSREGSLMVFGRSGTGKTICLTDKMRSDRQSNASLTQLFVARSMHLCSVVKSYQQNSDSSFMEYKRNQTTFLQFRRFVDDMLKRVKDHMKQLGRYSAAENIFNNDNRVTTSKFKDIIWKQIASSSNLNPSTVWTQIHTNLKGSVEVIVRKKEDGGENYEPKFKYLTYDEYMNLEVFPKQRCKLMGAERDETYKIFERYQAYLHDEGLWDDSDKVLYILQHCELQSAINHHYHINFNFTQLVHEGPRYFYDKVYVDEVQDFTQSEIILFFLAAGMNSSLFMVGDSAQAVEQAVAFRFEEVRSLVYKITNHEIPKPEKLYINFRSHQNILNLARKVLEKMNIAFPNSSLIASEETGLLLGPKVNIYPHNTITTIKDNYKLKEIARQSVETLKDVVRYNPKAYFLTPEQNVQRLRTILNADNVKLLSIVDSKGLEFNEVVIVDFFSCIPITDADHWKDLFKEPSVIRDYPPEIEHQLKNLYVAITRCRNRLTFIETGCNRPNGKEFEITKTVWRNLYDRGKDNPNNLVENFVPAFDKQIRQQSDSDLMPYAFQRIQSGIEEYDEDDQKAIKYLSEAMVYMKQCAKQDFTKKLELQIKIFIELTGPLSDITKQNCIELLKECLTEGMYDNISRVLRKIYNVYDDYDEVDTISVNDVDVDNDSDYWVYQHLVPNLTRILEEKLSALTHSSSKYDHMHRALIEDSIKEFEGLYKNIRKKVKRNIEDYRAKKDLEKVVARKNLDLFKKARTAFLSEISTGVTLKEQSPKPKTESGKRARDNLVAKNKLSTDLLQLEISREQAEESKNQKQNKLIDLEQADMTAKANAMVKEMTRSEKEREKAIEKARIAALKAEEERAAKAKAKALQDEKDAINKKAAQEKKDKRNSKAEGGTNVQRSDFGSALEDAMRVSMKAKAKKNESKSNTKKLPQKKDQNSSDSDEMPPLRDIDSDSQENDKADEPPRVIYHSDSDFDSDDSDYEVQRIAKRKTEEALEAAVAAKKTKAKSSKVSQKNEERKKEKKARHRDAEGTLMPKLVGFDSDSD